MDLEIQELIHTSKLSHDPSSILVGSTGPPSISGIFRLAAARAAVSSPSET